MVYCKGKFLKAEPAESKGFKFTRVYLESRNPAYPHILKAHKDFDPKKFVDKSGMCDIEILPDAYDPRIRRYTPRVVNYNVYTVKE